MRIFLTTLSTLLITAVTMTCANANHPTNNESFTKQYAKFGNWEIFSGNADTCVADMDNGSVQLRVMFTNYTGEMGIGLPYYEHVPNVNASFGFGLEAHEALFMETDKLSGWAMHKFETGADAMYEGLRQSANITFHLDRGKQTFSLKGSSRMLDLLDSCVRGVSAPAPRIAQNNQRQQQNVQQAPATPRRQNNSQNNSQNREQRYASVRGWPIDAVFDNNGFSYCAGTKVGFAQSRLRIAHGSGKWGIGLQTSRVGNSYGTLDVDYSNGNRFSAGSVPYQNDGDGWAATQLTYQFVRHLKAGSMVFLDIGTGSRLGFPLSGSTAAMLKLEECARNQGRKPARRVAQAPRRPAVQPAPRRRVTQAPRQQFNANNFRKAVLTGTWVWDDPTKNSQQNAVVSTIEIIGANSARYCYGFPCWDVTLRDGPNNTITFSHDGVAHFEFWETGPNQISANFWENRQYSTNSPPDAYVNMR